MKTRTRQRHCSEITEATSGVPGYESDVRAIMRRHVEGTAEQALLGHRVVAVVKKLDAETVAGLMP